MSGMNRHTGAVMDGTEHLAQSIADILTTPLGSCLARRAYGSWIPELIDQPVTPALILKLYGATAVAISRWENRFQLRRVSLETGSTPGKSVLTLEGHPLDPSTSNSLVRLTIPLS